MPESKEIQGLLDRYYTHMEEAEIAIDKAQKLVRKISVIKPNYHNPFTLEVFTKIAADAICGALVSIVRKDEKSFDVEKGERI